MPITPVVPPAVTRYYAVGVTEVLWVATIANPAAPTYAELDGGSDLSGDIADWAGWTVSTAMIDTPDLKNRFVSQLPGRISAEASSLTLYQDKLGVDTRTLMPRDAAGFIVIADGGLAAGKGDVFPVLVASVARVRSLDNAATLRHDFAITGQPRENVTLPQTAT